MKDQKSFTFAQLHTFMVEHKLSMDDSITIAVNNRDEPEFFGVDDIRVSDENLGDGILDAGQCVLMVKIF
jgi:hypothetical protein